MRTAALLAVFLIVAIALACPDVRHLASVIPGDSGDALLNLWLRAPSLRRGLLTGLAFAAVTLSSP